MEKEKKPKHFIRQPEFPGGPKALTQFIYTQLRYPAAAEAEGVEGAVYCEITINHKGVVTDVRMLQGLGFGCDEEAARVLKMLQFDVGKNRGIKVLFHKKIKVQFKKPVAQTPAPPPQMHMQVQYVVTPAAPETPQAPQAEPATQTTYSYTIQLP
jgi:TonB family protein